jgi:hypothetical protein
MSDEDRSKKNLSPVEAAKQRLIDDLVKVQMESEDKTLTAADVEAQRHKVLGVLETHQQQIQTEESLLLELKVDADAVKEFVDGGQRTLDQILVSKESWPFKSIEQLEEKFGKPGSGYVYWPLVTPGQKVSQDEANDAANVIRIPRLLAEELDERYGLTADEFDAHALRPWLSRHSLEVNRIWAYRILVNSGILRDGSVPIKLSNSGTTTKAAAPSSSMTRAGGSVPSAGASRAAPQLDSADWVEAFVEAAVQQYDADEQGEFGECDEAVQSKVFNVAELDREARGGRTALAPLLDHPSLAVRVSAATYLLKQMPSRVVPMLQKIATIQRPAELKQPHARWAAIHAQQTLWVDEDGLLDV